MRSDLGWRQNSLLQTACCVCRFRHDLQTTSDTMSSMSVERSWRQVCFFPPPSGIVSNCLVGATEAALLLHSGDEVAFSADTALAANPPNHLPLQAASHTRQPSTESSVKLRVMNYNILGASLVSSIIPLQLSRKPAVSLCEGVCCKQCSCASDSSAPVLLGSLLPLPQPFHGDVL